MEREAHEKTHKREKVRTDRDDRETCESVMDKKTRLTLFKLISQGLLADLQGAVSTGKEASVYLGMASPGLASKMCRTKSPGPAAEQAGARAECSVPVAIKIYKTSTMVFRDREKYITGERRFKRFSRGNSRKLVKLWAEKEVRNLHRLQAEGVPSPRPLFLRRNILIMTLLGTRERPAPRLKDHPMGGQELAGAYAQSLEILKALYGRCGLVHADFSEYNLLYWEGRVYVIDVSQAVEKDHPNADEFLWTDIRNITAYFGKRGVDTRSEEHARELIVAPPASPEARAGAEAGADGRASGRAGCRAAGLESAEGAGRDRESKRRVKEENRARREAKTKKKDKKLGKKRPGPKGSQIGK